MNQITKTNIDNEKTDDEISWGWPVAGIAAIGAIFFGEAVFEFFSDKLGEASEFNLSERASVFSDDMLVKVEEYTELVKDGSHEALKKAAELKDEIGVNITEISDGKNETLNNIMDKIAKTSEKSGELLDEFKQEAGSLYNSNYENIAEKASNKMESASNFFADHWGKLAAGTAAVGTGTILANKYKNDNEKPIVGKNTEKILAARSQMASTAKQKM